MARSNTGSSSNRYTQNTVPFTAAPCTIAAWFNPANLTSCSNLVFVTHSSFSNYFGLIYDGANLNGAGDNVFLADCTQSTSAYGVSPTGGVAGTWMHGAAVFTSATSRQAFMNGVGGTVNTTSKTPAMTTPVTHLGGISTFSPMNGALAEVALWNVALTADEVLALSRGVCPLLIRPNNLNRYWPLLGSGIAADILCRVSGLGLTTVGTMAKAAHAPVWMPQIPLGGQIISSGPQTVDGALFTDSDTFFAATITTGPVTVTGALFTEADTFFTSTFTATYSITGAVHAEPDTFFSSTFTTGPVTVTGALFTEADTFFAATITTGAVSVTGALFTESDTFFGATVTAGVVTIGGALFTESDTFFASTFTVGPVSITGALFTEADTFFAATITTGPVTVTGALFTEADTFFGATIVTGAAAQQITGALFSEADTFFSATLTSSYAITGALHTEADTFFASVVNTTYQITAARHDEPDTFFASSFATGGVSVAGGLYVEPDTFFAATFSQDGGVPLDTGITWLTITSPRRRG